MNVHLYLTLIPETLVLSMLNPEEFAVYYAIGERSKSSEQVMFIEVDPTFRSDFFDIETGISRCVPSANGKPKSSVYVAIYRVLEHIPISAMDKLYYVTRDGRSLGVAKMPAANNEPGLHLYSELAPTRPAVVSPHGPLAFKNLMMGDQANFKGLPAIAFAELKLGQLSDDPENGIADNLPYDNIQHLRNCLLEVGTKTVASKLFSLSGHHILTFRMLKHGVFVASAAEGLFLYPMPNPADLRKHHYDWWRSINT